LSLCACIDVNFNLQVIGTLSKSVTYDAPVPTALNRANAPSMDRSTQQISKSYLTLVGINFGGLQLPTDVLSASEAARQRIVLLGVSASPGVVWTSDSTLICRTVSGYARTKDVVVTIGMRISTGSLLLSYDVPTIMQGFTNSSSNFVQSTKGPTSFIFAAYLGPTNPSSTLRIFTASERSLWLSDSRVSCTPSLGYMHSITIALTAGSIKGSSTSVFSYNIAVVSLSNTQNQAMKGFSLVTLLGTKMGLIRITQSMRMGRTASSATVWTSDTICLSRPTSSIAASLQLAVTGGIKLQTTTVAYSFDALKISEGNGTMNIGKTGGSIITVAGQNYAPSIASRLGLTNTERSVWISDTSMLSKSSSGILKSLSFALTSAVTPATWTQLRSYDTAALIVLPKPNSATGGFSLVIVQGQSLGAQIYTQRSRVGGSAGQTTIWTSDTAIAPKMSSGVSSSIAVTFTATRERSTLSRAYSFDLASLLVTIKNQQNTYPALHLSGIVVLFANSGRYDSSLQMDMGQTRADSTLWISDSGVFSKFPSGSGQSLRVFLTVQVSRGNSQLPLASYDSQIVSAITPVNFPSSSDVLLLFQASNLGSVAYSGTARSAESRGESSPWISDTSMTVNPPAGFRHTRRMVLTHSIHVSSQSWTLSYDKSYHESVHPVNSPVLLSRIKMIMTSGGLLLLGQKLTIQMNLIGTSCESSAWVSETAISCQTPAGSVSKYGLVAKMIALTVGEIPSTLTSVFTYDENMVSSARMSNAAVSGLRTIQFYGRNVAKVSTTNAARIGMTGCEKTLWASDSSVFGIVSASLSGGSLGVFVTAIVSRASVTTAWSYDKPSLSLMTSANLPITSGYMISPQLQSSQTAPFGRSLSRNDASIRGRVGVTACENSMWISESALLVRVAYGSFRSRALLMTIESTAGSISNALSYSVPNLSRSLRINRHTSGSLSLTVLGKHFMFGWSLVANMGSTANEGTIWISDSAITLQAAAGRSSSSNTRITAGMKVGSISDFVSFDLPLVSIVKRSNSIPANFFPSAVLGSGYWLHSSSIGARNGFTNFLMSSWLSDTSLLCRLASSLHSSTRLVMTVGSTKDSLTNVMSQDLIVMSSVGRDNSPKTGSVSISVIGSQFGGTTTSSPLRQHISRCEASIWRSDSSVVCKTTSGLVFALLSPARLILSVGDRVGSSSSLFSIYASQLSSTKASNGAVIGIRDSITVSGSQFGIASFCASLRFGLTNCEASVWFSDTSIPIKRAKGFQRSLLSLVTLGHSPSSQTEFLSFNAPNFRDLVADSGLQNRPSTGTSSLTVGGVNFGVSSICPRSVISSTQCESSLWDSNTGVVCKVVPFGSRSLRAFLTVGNSGATISQSFSFDLPDLSTTYGRNRKVNGNIFVRIAGSGFGNPEQTLGSRSSGSACEQSIWMSDTEVSCVQGSFSNSGFSKRLSFTVIRRTGSLTELLSFDVASMTLPKARYNTPRTGSAHFTVWGINVGTTAISAIPRTGFTAAQSSKWISDSSVWCMTSWGLRSSRMLLLTSGNAMGCSTGAFSYAGLASSAISTTNKPTTGTVSVSIFGMGFGAYIVTSKLHYGYSSCEATTWTSTSTIRSRISAGATSSAGPKLTAQLGISSLTAAHSFDEPLLERRNVIAQWCSVAFVVNCSIGANCSTACNTTRKILANCTRNSTVLCSNPAYNAPSYSGQEWITGLNFGLSEMSIHSRLGRTESEKTDWKSDTAVIYRTALGLENSRAIVLTASMRAATASELYSFNSPIVRAVRLNGQQFLTVKLSVQCTDDSQADILKLFEPPKLLNLSDSGLQPPSLLPRSSQPARDGNYTFLYAFVQGIPCVSAYVSRVISSSLTPQLAVLQLTGNISSFSKRELECQLPKSASLQVATVVNSSLQGNISNAKGNVSVFASKQACSKVTWWSDTYARCELLGQTIFVPLKCAATIQIDSCLSGESSESECRMYDAATCAANSADNIRGNIGGNTPPNSPEWSVEAISGLGMDSSSVSVRTGRTASPHSRWMSESSVECRTASGLHGTYFTIVTAGIRFGSLTEGSSYDSTSVKTLVFVVNVPTTGSVSMTAFGAALSRFGYTPTVRFYTNAESTTWRSDSSLRAKVAGGAAARLRIFATVGTRQDGTLSDSLSYDSPSAYSIIPSFRPSTGVTTVSIIGANLATGALSQQVRIGGTPCESARWISTSTLLCRVAAGVHTMQQVIVTALQQTSNFPPDPQQAGRPKWPLFFFSYMAPVIYRTPSASGPMAYGTTRGGWTLTIQGANFGTASDLVRVSLGSTIWPSKRIDCKLVRASLCVGCGDAQLSDSFVHCLVPPGDGSSLGIVMQVGDQTSVLADGFSYSRPVIRSVSSWDTCDSSTCGSLFSVGLETSNPSEGHYPADTKTTRLLVITGENLGISEVMTSVPLPSVRSSLSPTEVSIGTAACSNVVVNAAGTTLYCAAPVPRLGNAIAGTVGCQALRVVVSIRNQTSAPSSRFSLVYLENMPAVIPTAGSNVRGYAWMDGDGAGMTLQFGIQAGTKGDVWAPVRTNRGRQYVNRPGARSDDFAYVCTPSPATAGDTGCGKFLVSKQSTDLWSIIGAEAICSWRSDSVLHVRFGFGATIVPSLQPPAILKTRPGVVMNFGAPSYAVDIDILVVPPITIRYPADGSTAQSGGTASTSAVSPRVVLQSPAYIGPCDDLKVTAFVDFASGSRDTGLTYTWTSSPDLTQIRNTPSTGSAASSAIVPWNDRELDYGVAYTVTLVVTNFLGQSGTDSITVIREQFGVPTVMILGGSTRRIRRDQMVVINAAANLPGCLGSGCTCTSASSSVSNTAGWGGAAAVLEFQWSEIGGTPNLQQAAALGTTSVLVLPVSSVTKLVVGANYTIQVEAGVWTGFDKNEISFYSTIALVSLVPYSVPPVARIRYGNRDFSKAVPVTLDGSASFDPDALFENSLKFQWYLDAGAMYDRMPLHLKEQRGLMSPGVVSRKNYITFLQGSACTLSRMIFKTNNAKSSKFQSDAAFLQESTPLIPDLDFQYFVWGSATPVPTPPIPWPVLVVIGLYVTDADNVVSYTSVELSFYDPQKVVQEQILSGVNPSVSFPVSIEPLLDTVSVAENDLVLRVRLDDSTMNQVAYPFMI
jgi:hypothetical protein